MQWGEYFVIVSKGTTALFSRASFVLIPLLWPDNELNRDSVIAIGGRTFIVFRIKTCSSTEDVTHSALMVMQSMALLLNDIPGSDRTLLGYLDSRIHCHFLSLWIFWGRVITATQFAPCWRWKIFCAQFHPFLLFFWNFDGLGCLKMVGQNP